MSLGEPRDALYLHHEVVDPFAENSWLVGCRATGRAVLVDPGGQVEALHDAARRAGLEVEAIWLTHAHIDHIMGIAAACRQFGDLPILLHRDDAPFYEGVVQQAVMFGLRVEEPPPVTGWLEAPGALRLGDLEASVIHLPGHSPGHVGFYFSAARTIVQGDVLFAGSIGRTDLPGGDYGALMESIVERLLPLGDDVRVLCGHGPATTIGQERQTNPFLHSS